MFSKREGEEKQGELWIESARVSKPKSQGFYSKLNEHLAGMDLARQVWAWCAPAYCEESRGGRPGIDPVVYLKMLMVGFFENLRSERAIAARCEDSLSVRGVSGLPRLEESTPQIAAGLGGGFGSPAGAGDLPRDFRGRCSRRLRRSGLFRGRRLGIEFAVRLEASAGLASLVYVRKYCGQAYWEYVKELASERGRTTQQDRAARCGASMREASLDAGRAMKNGKSRMIPEATGQGAPRTEPAT